LPPLRPAVCRWTIASGTSRYWRFETFEETEEIVILATWPRVVATNFLSWSMMNIDLRLHRVEGTSLLPLTGDNGLPFFDSGTVVSESDVDNVELLVVRGLEPGEYVFEIFRNPGASSTSVAVAWLMPETVPPAIPGDINLDGQVNGADLGLQLIQWGECPASGPCTADLNLDGVVNGVDLGMLLQNWGAGG
ncbi:MAG: dockerin type I repeat-containing protein, partial [Phycisphaerales bacterium]